MKTVHHSRFGGTFFTMLIFVMLLISTALMYYYFQRTRALQAEIAALRSGETPPRSFGFSFLDRLTGNSGNSANGTGIITSNRTEPDIPVGAASTPTPAPAVFPADTVSAQQEDTPDYTSSLEDDATARDVRTLPDSDILPTEREFPQENTDPEPGESTEDGVPIQSLYDRPQRSPNAR